MYDNCEALTAMINYKFYNFTVNQVFVCQNRLHIESNVHKLNKTASNNNQTKMIH